MTAPVVYEVNLRYDGDDAAGFDGWLEGHVEQMLAIDGFVGATIGQPTADGDDAGTARTVQYRLDSQASLDRYLADDAARMRADGQARFGERLTATRRVLSTAVEKQAPALVDGTPRCRNCLQPLTGQYCAECGQRDKNRMISLFELFRDFIGDLFELDSRLWRSLVPLLFRPGKLTLEYLSGRRVRYTPPLRMYLVLSLLFFVVVTTGQNINFEDGDEPTTPEERERVVAEAVEAMREANMPQEAIDSLAAQIAAAQKAGSEERDSGSAADGDADEDSADDDAEPGGAVLRFGDDCELDAFPDELKWLEKPAVVARFKASCERFQTAAGRNAFAKDLLGNVPTMMFVFLPIMAFVMKFLYAGSRRYYVEHLLFFVHFHSFYYLLAAFTVGLARLPDALFPGQGTLSGILIAALVLYSPYYLFRSMRVVYGQHWLITFTKFLVLNVAYFTGLVLTFTVTALVTALLV
ncbi:MAG: DUF4286 family protein [Pseudomonadota bacterium]